MASLLFSVWVQLIPIFPTSLRGCCHPVREGLHPQVSWALTKQYSLTSLPSAQGTGMTPAPQPQQTCLTTGGPGWSEVPASPGFPGHISLSPVLGYCSFLTGSVFHLLLCAGWLPLSLVVLHLKTFKDSLSSTGCPLQATFHSRA